jgi:hypothetical protein
MATVAGGPGVPGVAAHAHPSSPPWAPAGSAAIHPGVQTVTDGGQCTANFLFTDGTSVYIGQAAHCASTGTNLDTDGCRTGSQPIGTAVTVDGAAQPGTLAYSSWVTMQALGESDRDVCAYNDLALVLLSPNDASRANPSVPVWGGPTGLASTAATAGESVYSYGNSSLRLGVTALSPKEGRSVGDSGNGWSHIVYTATPGIPGDSGSGVLDQRGQALGVLSTLDLAPDAGGNGVGDLNLELQYLHAHAPEFAKVHLATGTQPFRPNSLPIG